MKSFSQFFTLLAAVLWAGMGIASQTRVVINLSEQKAYLIKQDKVIFVSPISSGRRGWSTPTGHFRIFSKDIDHRSGSFGSVIDASGRVINANATPGSQVPRGGHFRRAPTPYYMEFNPAVGMHGGYLPGYPASHGCVRMPREFAAQFFTQVQIGTPVSVVGSTDNIVCVRKALPVFSKPSFSRGPTLTLRRLFGFFAGF
jgi:lipoprotein-anchoring transpeptidase ErfK/SrfK